MIEAREALAADRAIIARLVELCLGWSQERKDLAWFDQQIAELKT